MLMYIWLKTARRERKVNSLCECSEGSFLTGVQAASASLSVSCERRRIPEVLLCALAARGQGPTLGLELLL